MGGVQILPMSKFMTHLILTLALTLAWVPWQVDAYAEICSDGALYQISHKDCPAGVVFREPQTTPCTYPDPDARGHFSEFCGEFSFDGSTTNAKIQYVDVGSTDTDGPNDASYPNKCAAECSGAPAVVLNSQNAIGDADADENDTAEEVPAHHPDPKAATAITDQTMRLFMYMTDHLMDENPNGPNILLVDFLRLSFSILKKHSSTQHLTPEFVDDIQKGFLFLLRESETGKIKDVSLLEYKTIKTVLDKCLATNTIKPFTFQGTQCKPLSKITKIIKEVKKSRGHTDTKAVTYMPNELSFKWGKYDFPVDATWGAMDFTHGLCYGVFNLDPNSHHLYERAMEGLFTREVVARWRYPPILEQPYYWNHIFRSNVITSMRNLDACIQATYLDSPFLHRLRRPWITKQDVEHEAHQKIRRKRSVGVNAWCLQLPSEKDFVKKSICPHH